MSESASKDSRKPKGPSTQNLKTNDENMDLKRLAGIIECITDPKTGFYGHIR